MEYKIRTREHTSRKREQKSRRAIEQSGETNVKK